MPTRAIPRSRWQSAEARRWAATTTPGALGLRVYASRLLGADASLVLAGGGNTSVKATLEDLHGRAVEALFVKASGADLATATAADFTPLKLASVRLLAELDVLPDRALARELLRLRLDPEAPPPSVEALLHAFLPHRFVDHAHPDALLALLDSADGDRRAAELYGDDCLVVPYVKPGFALAVAVRRAWRAAGARTAQLRGMVLLRHGVFAFADDARASYETLLELVARAARALPRRPSLVATRKRPAAWSSTDVARLRGALCTAAGRPLCLARRDERDLLAFLDRADLARVTRRGPLTPDHVLRTKRRPLVVRDARRVDAAVAAFVAATTDEFERLRHGRALVPLDPAPRVVLVPGTGVFGAGATPRDARLAAEIYARTAWAIARAEALGGYRPLAPAALFEVEYWELEQAKLRRAGDARSLDGRIALVTGAASGIGRAAAEALLAQGAAVVGLDLAPCALAGDFVGVEGDARAPRVVRRAIETAVRRFGGLDIVVANAGVFFAGPTIETLADADWRRTMALNLDAQLVLLRESAPLLKLAPAGGAVVVVGSKNVAAPGRGAAAYSASKAALTQLARVAALEWASDGIRVNVVHPDAVFDTGVWTPERLAERAANYGLTVEAYRRRNLLRREVRSTDVGALVAALCGDLFARTTGAQIPIDGGNERVI
jgi:rhamnose utilization protein RhaD (predicted bifunctional aldolase and dehydrogenase)/NAD(P)-dependent dehydrogenase (short-subunit alcohol dehydrogenase family)